MLRSLVAASVSAITYLVASNVLHGVAALLGVQPLLWPHITPAIWAIRMLSALAAAWVGCSTLRRLRTWKDAKARVCALVWLTVLGVVGPCWFWAWLTIGATDTDYQLVGPAEVEIYLPDALSLPPSAHDVHFFAVGQFSPAVHLTFRASTRDAEAYINSALSLDHRHERLSGEDSYIPHPDASWWRKGRTGDWWYISNDEFIFIHLDQPNNTIYLIRRIN